MLLGVSLCALCFCGWIPDFPFAPFAVQCPRSVGDVFDDALLGAELH